MSAPGEKTASAATAPPSLWRRWRDWWVDRTPFSGGCGACPAGFPPLAERFGHGLDVHFPVDAVVSWVDGADPGHAARRAAFAPPEDDSAGDGGAAAPPRFRDNGELRYALRAMAAFAPWLRSIVLVTDRQRPKWLNEQADKVRVVDHADFIPAAFLPTFNSHVIEAYLHRVPGLAEHYLYFNDDMFLARPCAATDFFTPNGLPLTAVDWRRRRRYGFNRTDTPHARSYHNTMKFLRERGVAAEPGMIAAHGPLAQTRTNAEDGFAFYADWIAAFSPNRFRTKRETAFYAHALPLWGYPAGRVVPVDVRYYYVQTLKRDRGAYYRAILRSRAAGAPPLFFCLNDVGGGDGDPWREEMLAFLAAYLPHPSPYETPPA